MKLEYGFVARKNDGDWVFLSAHVENTDIRNSMLQAFKAGHSGDEYVIEMTERCAICGHPGESHPDTNTCAEG